MNTQTNIDNVINFLKKFTNSDGIPVVEGKDWDEMNSLFSKEEIKRTCIT